MVCCCLCYRKRKLRISSDNTDTIQEYDYVDVPFIQESVAPNSTTTANSFELSESINSIYQTPSICSSIDSGVLPDNNGVYVTNPSFVELH